MDNVDLCPDKAGPTYNRGCPLKLYLLGPKLDTLGFAYQDKDGAFVFGDLKSDESYLFMLEIFDVDKVRSEEHTSELQSRRNLVCRLLLEKKKPLPPPPPPPTPH